MIVTKFKINTSEYDWKRYFFGINQSIKFDQVH